MIPPTLQWGGRVGCSHTGCQHVLESWSEGGTPPLHRGSWGVTQDWYWKQERSGQHPRIAYCPDHRDEAIEYHQLLRNWEQARREVGAQAHNKKPLTFWQKIGLSKTRHEIGITVWEWQKTHPRPVPPWQNHV